MSGMVLDVRSARPRRRRLAGSIVAACAAVLLGSTSAGAVGADLARSPGRESLGPAGALSWSLTTTGTSSRLRGLAAVSRSVAWASGYDGAVIRTVDGGLTWTSVGPAGTADLQFRDVEAVDSQHAVVMAAGEGESSRIYTTTDGGGTWVEAFRNTEPAAFYDCMAFTSAAVGYAVSDPVDGRFRIITTTDGGLSWDLVDPSGMPVALPGEFGFAASGTCLTADVSGRLHLGSGGADPGRVFESEDGGATWDVTLTPVAGSGSAGIFSLSFRGPRDGVLVGGDFFNPTGSVGTAAWTSDGGLTWNAPTGASPGGYRSGSAWVNRGWGGQGWVIAVGPTGSDVSRDGGRTWSAFDTGSFDAVQCTRDGACWASGEQGRVAVLAGLR
jgi:photosystem II stability/assembly factor-like uncharacterized protein